MEDGRLTGVDVPVLGVVADRRRGPRRRPPRPRPVRPGAARPRRGRRAPRRGARRAAGRRPARPAQRRRVRQRLRRRAAVRRRRVAEPAGRLGRGPRRPARPRRRRDPHQRGAGPAEHDRPPAAASPTTGSTAGGAGRARCAATRLDGWDERASPWRRVATWCPSCQPLAADPGRRPRPRPPPAGPAPGPPRADLARLIPDGRRRPVRFLPARCHPRRRGAAPDAMGSGRSVTASSASCSPSYLAARRAVGHPHRHRRRRDAARLGRADARRRAARPPRRPPPPAADRLAAADRHRARLRRGDRRSGRCMVVALVGTLNPSGGDVSVFLPTEQALLPGTAPDDAAHRAVRPLQRSIGALVAAVGALCAGVPEWIGDRLGVPTETALRWTFVALRRARRRHPAALPHAVARRRADRPAHRTSRARPVATRSSTGSPRSFSLDALRRWLRAHRARRAVAAEALRPVDRRQRGDVLLGRRALGVLGARRGADRRPHRPRPHDGLHAPPGERVPRSSPRSCRRRRSRSPPCWRARRCRRWTCRPARPT